MPSESSSIPAPADLDAAGGALWSEVASKYALRADELAVLEDACRTSDMIAALEAEWVETGKPMTTKGSMGQLVIHPLIGELRAQRAARAALLSKLKLPDDDAGAKPVADRSEMARKAAQARWNRGA